MNNNTNLVIKTNAINAKLIRELGVKIQKDWISECVNFFHEQNEMSTDELIENVKTQFYLANINETSSPVIPDTFANKKDQWTFNAGSKIVLQMQYILEICKSQIFQLIFYFSIIFFFCSRITL
jgi:hypothetical protein